MHVFLRQEDSVAVVAGLSQDLYGDLHIKMDFAFAALLKCNVGQQPVQNMARGCVKNKKKKEGGGSTLSTF